MQVLRGGSSLRQWQRPTALTLGNFDGVHRGHQALVQRALALAEHRDAVSAVVLFEPQPREYLTPTQAPPRLYPLARKLAALRGLGLELAVVLRFDAAMSAMSAEDFVAQILLERLQARAMVIGDDWRFGRDRLGDFALLQRFQARHGFHLEQAPTITASDERISSTRIRAALGAGNPELAQRLLGRRFSVSGCVVTGRQLGRQLGAPTANVRLRFVPPLKRGVYTCWLNGAPAVANFGTKPTFAGEPPGLEVHVLEGAPDLYNQRVEVAFGSWLRAEQAFADVAALAAQIHRDFATARDWHARHHLD